MVRSCNACLRRLLSHSADISCSLCNSDYHFKCIIPDEGTLTTPWYCPSCSDNLFPYNHIQENDEFNSVLAENWCNFVKFPFTDLSQLQFNVLEWNNDQSLVPLVEIDPDLQYYNDINTFNSLNQCDYYLDDSFRNKFTLNEFTENSFSLMHLNIRSIPKNLDKLSCMYSL
jgi:hypothetical protein